MANQIPILIRKELLAHLRTLRLVVALVFTVVLCLFTTIMGSLDYSLNMRAYEKAVDELHQGMDEARVFEALQPDMYVPPQPVQILCRGIVQGAGQRFRLFLRDYFLGVDQVGASSADDLMNTLVQVDFVSVVSLVLSFLAIALGFDAICGEREQGTLRLLLSHSVSRGQVVVAKLLGGVLSVWSPLAIAFVASLLVMQANPDVHLTGDDWLRLFLLFLLTCLFLAEMFALSVLVSVYTRHASTSLIVCLFGWLILGSGYSSALPAVARHTLDWPPWQEFIEGRNAEWQHFYEAMDEWEEGHPPLTPAYYRGFRRDGILRYVHPQGYEWLDARAAFEFDKMLEMADRVEKIRWQNQSPLAEQQFVVDEWSVLSPVTGYRVLGKWLARSTLEDRCQIARYGFRYRESYIDFLRARFAAEGWRRWYTDDPPDTTPMIEDPASVTPEMLAGDAPFLQERLAWAEDRWQDDRDDPRRRLDLTGLPEVGPGWQRTLPESLQRMMSGLTIMILTLGLAVLLTVRRFQTYQLS